MRTSASAGVSMLALAVVVAACVGEDPAPLPATPAVCGASEKSCGGACVPKDDPSVGCAVASCEPCPGGPNAIAACVEGECASSCANGFADCDREPGNGCEAIPSTDVANCGECGHVCGAANADAPPRCDAGKCQVSCKAGFAHCTDRDDVGCETELAGDPLHCGACGHSCLGGACVEGKCQPFKLASAALPYGLAVDANHVYFTSWMGNYVMRVQHDGKCAPGAPCPEPFVEESDGVAESLDPRAIVSDGTNVFYSTASQIARRSAAKGPIQMWSTALTVRPGYLTLAGGKLWWTDGFGSLDPDPQKYLVHVRRSELDGSNVTVVARFNASEDGAWAAGGIAADATHIYWGSWTANGIFRAPLGVDGYCTELDTCERIHSDAGDLIAVDDEYVYWSRRVLDEGDTLYRSKKTVKDAARTAIATNQGEWQELSRGAVTGLALMGDYVYWAVGAEDGRTGPGSIRRARLGAAPCAGDDCEVVATVHNPTALVAAADGLYWTDSSSNGGIYRLAR